MSLTFTKLFSSITESTVWCEPAHTRLVWITMLAMADRRGRVWASIPGLANRARVPIDDTEKAIKTFTSPDKHSRTPDFEGRRIEAIDGGWRLLNYQKYRDIRDEEDLREKAAMRKRAQRERDAANVTQCHAPSQPVQPSHDNAEAEAEAERKNKSGGRPSVAPPEFELAWQKYPKRSGNNPKADALKAWNARVKAGVTVAAMLAGVDRYFAWCEATDKIGTETVMQAVRFFGPSKPFEQDWQLPRVNGKDHAPPWWSTDSLIEAKARELGISTLGLSRDQLKGRIDERLHGGAK